MSEKERIEHEIAVKRMLSPARINVVTARLKLERMKVFKNNVLMNWEEFIFDYFYELLDAMYNGVCQGIAYDDHSEAFGKVIEKWGKITNERIRKRGWMTEKESKELMKKKGG